MKKIKNISFEIDGDYWIGAKVFALTSYGLPVQVYIDKVDILVDKKKKGKVLGYFYNNYKFTPENLMSDKDRLKNYPSILDIPDFPDYVTYEVGKAFNKNKDFCSKYESMYVNPYKSTKRISEEE